LKIVVESSRQLNQLIDDVSSLRDSNTAKVERYTPLQMHDLFENIVTKLQEKSDNKTIKLTCHINSQIDGPKEKLNNIFKIILDNSVEFNENNEVLLDINYSLVDKIHHFEIMDNGIGIDNKYHDQVFGLFKRLNHRGAYAGSGLGLSIAQRLIESIGGTISIASSQLKQGTTILVKFPSHA